MTNSTNFATGTTITHQWLNDVNTTVFGVLGSSSNPPTTAAQLLANLGMPVIFTGSGGSTDVTSTLQAAVTSAANNAIIIRGTCLISTSIVVSSNTRIILEAGTVVTFAAADIAPFTATGATGITVKGPGSIAWTGTGGTLSIGVVHFVNCTKCHAEGVYFNGGQWSGVMLNGSSKCSIRFCYFANWSATGMQDSNDIALYQAAKNNLIEYNWCYGGGQHGILVQDPYSIGPLIPSENIVGFNDIDAHTAYGIALYMPAQTATFNGTIAAFTLTVNSLTTGALAIGNVVNNGTTGAYLGTILSGGGSTWTLDTSSAVGPIAMVTSSIAATNNKFPGNNIRNITGGSSIGAGRAAGAGFYLVGSGLGGTILSDIEVTNCCTLTNTRSLAPAGIGISSHPPGAAPITLSNCLVQGMTQGDGIEVVGCKGPVNINSCPVTMPLTNDGTGAGGGSLLGTAYNILNSSGVTLDDPNALNLGSGDALLVYANTLVCNDIVVTGGSLTAATGNPLHVTGAGGSLVSDLTIEGTRIKATGNTPVAARLDNCSGVNFNGTNISAGTQAAVSITGGLGVRFNGGKLSTTGSVVLVTSGTCTGGWLDRSVATPVTTGANGSFINNAGTGFNIEVRTTGVPSAGTWAVGDHWIQTTSVSGAAPGGYCTAAGTSGTWKSEANLA